MKILYASIFCIFFSLAACNQESVTTNIELSESEIRDAERLAEAGDRRALAKLAFHYGLLANKQKADYYFNKCILAKEPRCISDKISGIIGRIEYENLEYNVRLILINEARELSYEAFVNADASDEEVIRGLQYQARHLSKLIGKK